MATEKRLIDANEYKKTLEKMMEDACATHDWGYEAVLEDCIWELDAQTTVEAVPVVHGRWTYKEGDYEIYMICSECGWDSDFRTNYCPNCGADMRERKDNG